MTTKHDEFRKRWIEELRSGKYEQGKGALRNSEDKYCCLGVACTLLPDVGWQIDGFGDAYGVVLEDWCNEGSLMDPDLIGLSEQAQDTLITLNDTYGWDFNKIADVLDNGIYEYELYGDSVGVVI